MKRFWSDVTVGHGGDILLDGRPVRTPGRVPLIAPTPALSQAIAAEWRAVGDTLDPRAMPLTGLANAAIDRIAPDPARFAADLARYGETDLLCYRADAPEPLILRQGAAWDPVLDWAARRYDVHFVTASGIVHRAQPAATLDRLREAVASHGPFTLAPLSPIVTLTGSLLLALAVEARAIEPDAAWAAAHVDEDWQAEQWGTDALAAQMRETRRREFNAATRFLRSLD